MGRGEKVNAFVPALSRVAGPAAVVCVYALLYTDVVHAVDDCSKNHLCKEMAQTAIILMHGADSASFPAHLSLLKISNT